MTTGHAAMITQPSRKRLFLMTSAAAGVSLLSSISAATFAQTAASLPAAAPSARSFATPFRSDVIDIPLKASEGRETGNEVEYKVRLKPGAVYVYSWEVRGVADPEEFYTEFHGHTVEAGKAETVVDYRKATGISDNGVLTAPFDGVHGWFFQNQSAKPVTVTLRLAGFYELIPDGQPGNEAGLHARPARF